jgi:hypothetical protein
VVIKQQENIGWAIESEMDDDRDLRVGKEDSFGLVDENYHKI